MTDNRPSDRYSIDRQALHIWLCLGTRRDYSQRSLPPYIRNCGESNSGFIVEWAEPGTSQRVKDRFP